MNRIAPRFSGVYLWRFKLSPQESEKINESFQKDKEAKPWLNNKYLPNTLKTRLIKEAEGKSFDIRYLGVAEAVIVANDRRGNHLELLAISADPAKQAKTLNKLIANPHGILTTQNSQGDGVVFKPVWKIVRFFKGIGNFFMRLFGK